MSTTPTNVKEAQFEQYTRPYLKTVPRAMNARSHCTKSSITSWNAYHGFKGIGGKTERLFYTAAKGLDRVPSVNHTKELGCSHTRNVNINIS